LPTDRRALVAIAAVLVLLLVVGASARAPLGGGAAAPTLPAWPLLVVAGAGLVAACALGVSVRPHRWRAGGGILRAGPLTIAVAVLVPVVIFSVYSAAVTSGRHRTGPALPDFSTHAHRKPKPDEPGKSRGSGAAAFASGIAAGVLGLAAFAIMRARRRENAPEPRALVAAGARDALDAIAIPADPRAAVLAAYARMEAALASAGLARRASEAPREYLSRLEDGLGGGRAPAARLTGLFERARFSTHPIGEDVRSDALGALDALRADLERPA
jgi:Domain of unknown function (DUF4129)